MPKAHPEDYADALEALLGEHRDQLLTTILTYSQQHGFLGRVSADEESWRESIRRVGSALVEEAAFKRGSPLIDATEDFAIDPAARFGRVEGAIHRSRGSTFGLFIALMTHYRRAIEDLVAEKADPDAKQALLTTVESFFDRFVMGLGEAWNVTEPDALVEEMRRLTRRTTNEKDLYKTVLDGLNVPIMLLDESGAVVTANRAVSCVFDVGADFVRADFGDEDDTPAGRMFPALDADTQDFIASGELHRAIERTLPTRRGERRFLGEYQRITDAGSVFAGTTLILTDLTVHRELEDASRRAQHHEYLARHDALTGLPNRRAFEDALHEACARAGRGVCSALLFIDIDNFKDCNDSRGHLFGDGVLVQVGEAIGRGLREQDALGRLGGDEFGVVLEGATHADAEAAVARMRERVAEIGRTLSAPLGLSVGIALIDRDADVQALLAEADRQMYRDKGAGR